MPPVSADPAEWPFVPFSELVVGRRYLHLSKGELVPVTVRAILPASASAAASTTSGAGPSSSFRTASLVGIEYDDPSRGKHSGVLAGRPVFVSRREGAASFIKYDEAASGQKGLRRGRTMVEALEERYGVDLAGGGGGGGVVGRDEGGDEAGSVTLGGSGGAIVVEAPNIRDVSRRMKQLHRLKSIGLDGYNISALGGDGGMPNVLRSSLTALHSLDLSGSLLSSWADVAHILSCIPSLKELSLNQARLSFDNDSLAVPNVASLSLCAADLTSDDITQITRVLPSLCKLTLVDNPRLTRFDVDGAHFANLLELDIARSGFSTWDSILEAAKACPSLHTLDTSANRISFVPPPPPTHAPLVVTHLIWNDAHIRDWRSIDNLGAWTAGALRSFRFSRGPIEGDTTSDEAASYNLSEATYALPRDEQQLRLIMIAKLHSLELFNSSMITPAERRDAELFYLKYVRQASSATTTAPDAPGTGTWGRYDELSRKYDVVPGVDAPAPAKGAASAGPLKSNLIDLAVYSSLIPSDQPLSLGVLPSTPISLLRKKVARLLGLPAGVAAKVEVWTVKPESAGERAVQITPDVAGPGTAAGTVGWWFSGGEGVYVDVP